MAATGTAEVFPPPPLTPPPNGLLNTAQVIEHGEGDDRWINGITFQPENCNNAVTFDPCVTTGYDNSASFTDGATNSNTTVTSATAVFNLTDVDKTITGGSIPAGTTILGVTNATTITISQAAGSTATGVSMTISGRQPAANRRGVLVFQPFGVSAEDTCSTFGFQRSDYEGRARRALAARETKALEYEFQTATQIGGNRHLQDNTGTNTTTLAGGTAISPAAALAVLVQGIGDNNLGKGMIHARPGLVTAWTSKQLLRWDNGKLYTLTGTPVVPGSGYTGAGPAGGAVSQSSEWAYATDPVQVHRGPVEVFAPEGDASTVFRHNNQVTVRAQRMYSVVFNACAVLAVNVNAELS